MKKGDKKCSVHVENIFRSHILKVSMADHV